MLTNEKPKKPTVTVTNQKSSIKVSWKKDEVVTGYEVYRKLKGASSFKKVKTINNGNTLSFEDKNIKQGNTYVYRVRVIKGKYQSDYTQKIIVRLARPEITSAKNSSTKAITVKWKKNKNATGYQVKYVTGEKTKTATIKKNSTVSYRIKNLKKNKTYKVYVRSYKTVNGTKYYSAWSAVKKVKISK